MRIKKNLIQLVESNYTHFKQIKKGFFAEALGQWRQLLIRLTSMQTLSRIQRVKMVNTQTLSVQLHARWLIIVRQQVRHRRPHPHQVLQWSVLFSVS